MVQECPLQSTHTTMVYVFQRLKFLFSGINTQVKDHFVLPESKALTDMASRLTGWLRGSIRTWTTHAKKVFVGRIVDTL